MASLQTLTFVPCPSCAGNRQFPCLDGLVPEILQIGTDETRLRRISVNTRKKLIVALSIALSFIGLLGCGTTNHLQTIMLTAANATGTFRIKGINNVLQLKAIGTYSS